jgi:exopolysaccharide production protein ExoZ
LSHDGQKLDGLQVLRAAAALLVVSEHSYDTFCARLNLPPVLQAGFWALSGFGVCLFFAISGFIMMHTSGRHFGRPGAPRTFLLRRLWRIVPLYWAMTLVEAAKLWATGGALTGGDILGSFLFVPYRNAAGLVHPVLEAGWTLNFEMFFYLAFAAALLLSLRSGVAALMTGFGGLVAIGALGRWDAGASVPAAFASNPIILFFLAGIGVWAAWTSGLRLRLPAAAWLLALAALLAAGVAAAARDVDHDVWPLLPAVGLALLIGLSAPAFRGGAAIRTAVLLGDASYSIYLTHNFFLGSAGRVAARLGLPASAWPLFVCATVVCAAAIGVLVHRWVERPLLRAVKPLFAPAASVATPMPIPAKGL